MATRPVHPPVADGGAAIGDRAFTMVVAFAALLGVLAVAAVVFGLGNPRGAVVTSASPSGAASASPATSPGSFLFEQVRDAPAIELIDPDERPFSLAALRGGGPVLVFFGYTHCPDVCPATIGILGKVLAQVGAGSRAVFVSIDPARDTPAWLHDYVPYLPAGITAVTGTADRIRSTADAWGVRYARVETDRPEAYSMSHTADVFIVDAAGRLRGAFPFGTTAEQMVATLRAMLAAPAVTPLPSAGTPVPSAVPTASPSTGPSPSAGPTASSTPTTVGTLGPTIVSSAVWAGGRSPVILTLDGPSGRLNDPSADVTVQLETPDGSPVGSPSRAVAVQPPYEDRVLYVPTLDIPSPGSWRLVVSATVDGAALSGSVGLTALDPGSSAALGALAPTARTPTLADVGGDHWAVSTDPAPDLRFYQRSTTDALADHAPFVLVVDSVRFRVSPACGKALVLARYLVDRWPSATFIHLEPYPYAVVSETPVLEGDLSDPPLTDPALAWGIGESPWGARWVPWIFVVDGNGVVRAKYEGIIGSDDIDVILSLIAQGG
jgi:protein SCO1/2